MSSYLVKREAYLVALGHRDRLELSVVAPELVDGYHRTYFQRLRF
jgi:hypothetical protein